MTNSVIVSSWAAQDCYEENADMVMTSSTHKMNNGQDEMPDCHQDMVKKDTQNQDLSHCDGLCLCFHITNAQIPVLKAPFSEGLYVDKTALKRSFDHFDAHSLSISPPHEPPKFFA